jgi:hypothetical protein
VSFSLQRFLSHDAHFHELMEGGAEEAKTAVRALVGLLRTPEANHSLEAFVAVRRKE